MKFTATGSRGLLLKFGAVHHSFVQLTVGRGGVMRRLIFWPQHGQVALRVVGSWWLSVLWVCGGRG
jgi:hypothetical protein